MRSRIGSLFHKPPVDLTLVLPARAWEAGRPIPVRVVATGTQDTSISQVKAELIMRVWLREPTAPMAGAWGAAPPSTAPQRIVTGDGGTLRLVGDAPAGASAEYHAELPNWAQAPTGGRPPGRRIEYAIRAEARLADGRITRTESPILLVSGPDLYREIEGAQSSRHLKRCDIELTAPALRARPGETLTGTVRVVPHRPTRALSVRLFVVRAQTVRMRERPFRAPTLAPKTELSGPREFGFSAPVPDDAPTMITPYLSVRWHLRVVVLYGILAKDRLDTEINVYTQPP